MNTTTTKTDKVYLLAEQIYNSLESAERVDGEHFVKWKDSDDQDILELRKWFSEVSGEYTDHNFAELDEVYEVLSALAGLILDNDNEDMEEAIYNNQWSYDYNSNLLDWVGKSLFRAEDVNQAIREGTTELFPAIQQAMDRTRSSMAIAFYEAMQEFVR